MARQDSDDSATDLADLKAFVELRDRVGRAIEEIERLRRENANLRNRIRNLEQGEGDGKLMLGREGESPEELAGRVLGFIDAIDALLKDTADESKEANA